MKKLYSLCLVCCFAGILQAQTKIRYSYDASGNRVKREIVLSRVQNRALADPEDEKPLSEKFAGQTVRFYPNPTKGGRRRCAPRIQVLRDGSRGSGRNLRRCSLP